MSDPGPKPPAARNDGGGKEDRREPTSRGARPGYRTMPHELRAFRRPGVAASQETPEQQEAAEKLQEMGRGGDVLFDDVRERAPREPSPDDNRSEHAVMEVPRRPRSAGEDEDEARARTTAARGAVAGGAEEAAKPPSEPESGAESKRPARRRPSTALVVLAMTGFVVVALLVWVYRPRGGEHGEGGTMSGMGAVVTGGGAAGAMSVPTAATSAPSASAVETSLPAASAPSASAADTSTPAATNAPSVTTTAGAVPPATAATSSSSSGKAPPEATGEPQADAGAPPNATSAPTVAPAVTAAPSVVPSHTPSTTTSRPFAPITPEKD